MRSTGCIPSEEEIADDASPGLKQVRRQMHQANDRIRAQLNAMVNGGTRNYLQDAVITQRNGRFCYPGQGGIPLTGTRNDPRSVLYRIHTLHRTDGCRKARTIISVSWRSKREKRD